ncbi:hypothetical protein D3C81_585440 [compost metagenome]
MVIGEKCKKPHHVVKHRADHAAFNGTARVGKAFYGCVVDAEFSIFFIPMDIVSTQMVMNWW